MSETSTSEHRSADGVQRPQRCSACGGLNPPDAGWCGQCMVRFDSAPPGPSAPDLNRSDSPSAVDQEASAPERSGTSAASESEGAFKVTDEGISWTCSVCDTVNDLENPNCRVCGAPFARTVLPPAEKPERDPNMAALISLFLPGAGHAYVGLWGQAIARAIVSLWVVMVVFVSALQKGAASSNLVMVLFGVVAFALWGIGAHDAYREARDEHPLVILKGKVFFYMVLGLLLLLVALLMGAMMKAQG